MNWFFILLLSAGGTFCCQILDQFNYKIIYYKENEMLNLTIEDGSFPPDVEVTSITGSCRNQVSRLLPDQFFDAKLKKYKHVKQMNVPMSRAMADCVYYVTMRSASGCLVRPVAMLQLQPGLAACRCSVEVHIDWMQELKSMYTKEHQRFLCDAQNVMCEIRSFPESGTVLTSVQKSEDTKYTRTIVFRLKNEDISQDKSTFVCQDNTFTINGRLIKIDSNTTRTKIYYNIDDEYIATCNGSNIHWILETNYIISYNYKELVVNGTFSKKLRKEDDQMKLICIDVNCDDFEIDDTCYKNILNEVTFHLNSAVSYYWVLASSSVAALSLLVLVACVWCRCRRSKAAMDMSRRPRMATPPPERPPRRQLYYSVPFERPIPGPRRD